MTERIYYDPDAPLGASSKVVDCGVDEIGTWVEVSRTPLHVRGGGQPSDQGSIDQLPVYDVQSVQGQVRHYIGGPVPAIGSSVEIRADAEVRMIHSAWHTAGHLLAAVLEECMPELTINRANQYPGSAWVSGSWSHGLPPDTQITVQEKVNDVIGRDLPVIIHNDARRLVAIGTFKPQPCGGTHLRSTGELIDLEVKRVRLKKGALKASYKLSGPR